MEPWTLDDGTVLTVTELILIELMRRRLSDTKIRIAMDLTQDQLLPVSVSVREKLGCETWESTRQAADRHAVPRIRRVLPSD